MKIKLRFLAVILFLQATTYGQKVQFSVFLPPLKSTDNYYADFNKYVLPSHLYTMVTIGMIWSEIETSQGVYNFNTFDSLMQQFVKVGKKINIVTWPISPSGVNTYTPAYIFTKDWATSLGSPQLSVDTCKEMQGNGQPNSGMPAPYETPFKQGLKNFYAQVISHYKNNRDIGYIRLGLAVGGDFFPRCSSVMPGYTLQVWENYAKEMNDFEASQNPTMQLMQSVILTGADVEAANAVNDNISIGVQGWQISDNTAATCTSDWCALFAKYTGKIGPLELQTINSSQPDGVTSQSNATGSLIDLIPFAVSHKADVLELYIVDWLLALDPNYVNLKGNGIVSAYSKYASAYLNTITNCAQINNTGIVSQIEDNTGYFLYPDPSGNHMNIISPSEATKIIRVFNSLGQIIYTTKQQGKQIPVNTSLFSPGVYYINVKELSNENSYTLKYLK